MGQVVIEVNDRNYTLQCADGEEGHLRSLSRVLDAELIEIRKQVGAVGDVRLLLMAGLMVADRLAETERRVEALRDQIEGLRQSRQQVATQSLDLEELVARKLDDATVRLENILTEKSAT